MTAMRLLVLAAAAAPFFVYAARDLRVHLGPRKPGGQENALHVLLGVAQLALFVAAGIGHLRGEITAVVAVALLGALDEFVFHRGLPADESDLHAKAHFALFVFVATALAVNHVWTPS